MAQAWDLTKYVDLLKHLKNIYLDIVRQLEPQTQSRTFPGHTLYCTKTNKMREKYSNGDYYFEEVKLYYLRWVPLK